MSDLGLHVVAELVPREFIWLHQRGQVVGDLGTLLASLDDDIGPNDIGIFDRFDLLDDSLGRLTEGALEKRAGDQGCPLPGAGCGRGSHLDRRSYRNPRLRSLVASDGTKLSLAFPVHLLSLLPCSAMADATRPWDTVVLSINKTLRPSQRAKEMANGLFDKGVDGVFTAEEDFLSRPLPTSGIRMAHLPDVRRQ